MKKRVIVDTNIIFKALRSQYSNYRDVLDKSDLQFYSPNFLIAEIFKHKERIIKASKAEEAEIYELLEKTLRRINFVNEEFISLGNLIHAYKLCLDIDEKDTVFVALSLELDAAFWTKDDVLKNGLLSKGFDNFFDDTVY
jgi:predicted nucleic acid-binding protein